MNHAVSNSDSSPKLETKLRHYIQQIEAIDEELIEKEVPIHQRPSLALERFSQVLGVELPTHPPRREISEEDFNPEALSIRLYVWYQQRYGRRQENPFAIGHVATWLQGDLFRVHIPLKMSDDDLRPFLGRYGPLPHGLAPAQRVMLLDLVEGMNPAIKQQINESTAYDVLNVAIALEMGMRAYVPLYLLDDIPLLHESNGDLRASTFFLLEQKPRFHYSRWASLQAVEKTVKAYLLQQATESHLKSSVKKQSKRFGYGHDLTLLYNLAEDYGLARPPQQCIDFVQCDQAVRYGEVFVSIEQALHAQIHALQLVGGAARATAELLNRPIPDLPTFSGTVRIGGHKFTGSLDEIQKLDQRERNKRGRKK